ncbi:hypothetical protein HY857_02355 [Candidatus Saccharibacteria bacterium]|nr:hypothetical protein [Candidatus Saccharibacteria bacterium]
MKAVKRLSTFTLSLLILAVPIAIYAQRQAIFDWARLRNYNPPAAIAQLASDDTMTSKARHMFYVNHTSLVAKAADFRKSCPVSEQTIVLGCYQPIQNGIYIYDVADTRLNGVHEVTAAHEMLHAAYDRLSSKDKNYVNGLLQSYYDTQTDQRITDTVNAYKKSEPNDVVNEMHSVFGTEIADLPAPLENYYNQYFSNRAAVVSFSASYEGEFTNRLAKITSYDQQLAAMKQSIDSQEADLKNLLNQIESDRARLDRLKSSGDFAAYNAAVPGFNTEITAYNSGVTRLKNDIDSFNELVQTRNSLAAELRSLDSAIDTRLTPQAAQ